MSKIFKASIILTALPHYCANHVIISNYRGISLYCYPPRVARINHFQLNNLLLQLSAGLTVLMFPVTCTSLPDRGGGGAHLLGLMGPS